MTFVLKYVKLILYVSHRRNVLMQSIMNNEKKTDFTSVTCYEMLLETCNRSATLIFNGHKISMNKFLKHIEEFSISLVKYGFKKGEVLTLYLPTCPQALVAFYACSKLGVIANIVHPLMPLDKLQENLKSTNSKGLMFFDMLISDHNVFNDFGQILIKCSISDYVVFRKLPYYIFSRIKTKHSRLLIKYSKCVNDINNIDLDTIDIPVKGTGEDIVCSMHSGGTSGSPKIVQLQNSAFNNLSLSLNNLHTRDDSIKEYGLAMLPIFHAFGLGVSMHTFITNGLSLILMAKFKPKDANTQIKKHKVGYLAGVPIMFKKMMEQNNFRGRHLKNLRNIWCGGDVLNETFVEHFDTVLADYGSSARLMRGYGLTEVCSVCAVNTFDNYKKNSCGKAIDNANIEIWDDEENTLKPNEIGEIVVSSPCSMKSYLSEDGYVVKDDVKWIKTGDIGYLDKDGFLFILDRKKRSIKINAINVFPSEIEELVKTLDYVDEACAVPYSFDGKTFIRLYITKNDTKINDNRIKKEMVNLCKKHLIKYSVPREVRILDEMPRTNLGKIDFKKVGML